ncbi:hypothetical protein BUALT_Bualt04G0107700 [Buddleja alternifolia]|uniref:Uncharacterized protein n=1 Tax=Buddleja alternifolia TaxID=168488 RepID=A0AAV6XW13_9LAMI|nr:hypothetical protein BUALT_Bualt04G0107700 [Buddleja alternifolia]
MNTSANKGNNYPGGGEKRMETINLESSARQSQEKLQRVEVVHQPHSNTSGGILSNAAASVVSTLESAKDVISRK